MGPLLVFTILLSPFGLLEFLALRTAKARRSTRDGPEQSVVAGTRGSVPGASAGRAVV